MIHYTATCCTPLLAAILPLSIAADRRPAAGARTRIGDLSRNRRQYRWRWPCIGRNWRIGNCRDSPICALASSSYPARSQQARVELIRLDDNADRFVSTTPSHPRNMGWGRTALRGRKPTPRIGPWYSSCNRNKRRRPRERRACKREKPDHMSEPELARMLGLFPSSKSSKPKCAWQLPRESARHQGILGRRHSCYKSIHFARKFNPAVVWKVGPRSSRARNGSSAPATRAVPRWTPLTG